MPLRGFVCFGGGIICSLWRDGFRIGCRHLIISHAWKTLARSRAAGICDEGTRTHVWRAEPDRLSLFNTPRRGRRSGSWAAVCHGRSAVSTSSLPPAPPPTFYLMLGRELLHVDVKTPEARQEVVDHHLLGNDCGGGGGVKELKAVDAGWRCNLGIWSNRCNKTHFFLFIFQCNARTFPSFLAL